MQLFVAISVFLIYPTVFFVITDPAALEWAHAHGFSVMPDAEQLPMEEKGRILYFVKFLTVGILIWVWTRIFDIPLSTILHPVGSWGHLAILVVSSTVVLCLGQFALLYCFERVKKTFYNRGLSRGPLQMWLAIILVSGIIEETWRSLALSNSSAIGINSWGAVMATSVAFVFCRLLGIPSRNSGLPEEVFWELFVGAALGSFFILSGTVVVPLVINILYNAFRLVLVRSKIGQ